ncbi:MAG TPA: hypothetical protein VFZ90_10740 [Gemmatimonadales bacterium]
MDFDWVDRHTVAAPPALRARVRQYLSTSTKEPLPNQLAVAADSALARVLSHPGDRSVALDLLAADALITLALLAQAQTAPEQLEEFAISVLRSWRSKA